MLPGIFTALPGGVFGQCFGAKRPGRRGCSKWPQGAPSGACVLQVVDGRVISWVWISCRGLPARRVTHRQPGRHPRCLQRR